MKISKSLFGIVAILVLVASFVVPGKLASPEPVSADPGRMEWTWVQTPDSLVNQLDNLFSPIAGPVDGRAEVGSDIVKFLIGNDGRTIYAVIRVGSYISGAQVILMKSMNGGVTWMGTPAIPGPCMPASKLQGNLEDAYGDPVNVYDIAIAPDDPNLIIAAIAPITDPWLQEVWISQDGGEFWENTQWPGTDPNAPVPGTEIISALDVSMSYGQGRYILVGTRDGAGADTNNIQTMRIPGYGGWKVQDDNNPFTGDVITAKFSPTFIGDSTIVVVYSDADGTYLITGSQDIFANTTTWQPAGQEVEIKDPSSAPNASPEAGDIWVADLEMPSDFSGQTASLRRFYVSTAAATGNGDTGIYRIDDNVIYELMDTTTTVFKKIYSIAYWGTYASGKLLAGEVFGYTCTAQVPVWFTDSPTVCPIPCWYPAKKPPTGAAGCDDCTPAMRGFGTAWVMWSPTYADQGVAYATTGFNAIGDFSFEQPDIDPCDVGEADGGWPWFLVAVTVPLDESAFALTRNNGATWNELSLIDTRISKLTDVAPSADCTTVYLASANNASECMGFDSVWRSSSNEKVVAPPLPALPIGQIWERVYCHVTAVNCNDIQSEYAILRLAPDKVDGQVVGWAAGGTSGLANIQKDGGIYYPVGPNTRALAWSPDYGDFWATVNPRLAVQDMAFQDSTTLYVLDLAAKVQKMPYTGTAWASTGATVAANLTGSAHTIEASGAGRVIVGAGATSSFGASISLDGGAGFIPFNQPPEAANVGYHAILDTDFETNATVYLAGDGNGGKVRRNTAPAGVGAPFSDMCRIYVGPFLWTNHRSYYGIVQTNSKNVSGQGTLYAAHRPGRGYDCGANDWCNANVQECPDITGNTIPMGSGCLTAWSGVERTLRPLDGMPKPGIEWSCLDAGDALYRVMAPWFTLEPKSLKMCGCLTQDTDTTLYAIDNDYYANNHNICMLRSDFNGDGTLESYFPRGTKTKGGLWAYTDCVAKKGPKLTMADGTIIGCDPATGRNQEVNFTWEQLCIANWYEFVLAKNKEMTQVLIDAAVTPWDVTSPAVIVLAGGEGSAPDFYTGGWGTAPAAAAAKVPSLECGHTFYWMVRVIDVVTNEGWTTLNACGESPWGVPSPWSDIRSFTIKAGFRVTTPYYGVQLLSPDNGCGCPCDAPVSFSWSPFKDTKEYKFELSENADMSSPLVSTTVKGATAYQYTGKLKCNATYFWRVMATAPAPSEWSATFSFQTQAAPPPPTPPAPPPETPFWVWVVIAIGAILVIVTLVLIFKTRRV